LAHEKFPEPALVSSGSSINANNNNKQSASVAPHTHTTPNTPNNNNNATQVSIYYQNSRGLRSKSKRFFCTASTYDYDLIILTETWLHKNISSAEFFDASYTVFRRDRDIKRGGGVLIALKNETFASE
jgi:hypothetical protein